MNIFIFKHGIQWKGVSRKIRETSPRGGLAQAALKIFPLAQLCPKNRGKKYEITSNIKHRCTLWALNRQYLKDLKKKSRGFREDIQDTALSHSPGATTLPLGRTHSHLTKHRHSHPHTQNNRNILGNCGTAPGIKILDLICPYNGAKE